MSKLFFKLWEWRNKLTAKMRSNEGAYRTVPAYPNNPDSLWRVERKVHWGWENVSYAASSHQTGVFGLYDTAEEALEAIRAHRKDVYDVTLRRLNIILEEEKKARYA